MTPYTEHRLQCYKKEHILSLLRGCVPNINPTLSKEQLIIMLLAWQKKQEKQSGSK